MAISEPYPSYTSLASDKTIRPFLAPTFDPVDYLNAVLPSWTPSRSDTSQSSSIATSSSTSTTSITDLATQFSALLSQLSAQLTRLSALLSKATDDILRAGGRLAYEVDVLRSDSGSLHEALTEGLRADIERIVPGGFAPIPEGRALGESKTASRARGMSSDTVTGNLYDKDSTLQENNDTAKGPSTLRGTGTELEQLRTLSLVRDRLESVIKVFGSAIEWVIPPSEVSVKASLISVSAPEAGSEDVALREKKGKSYADKISQEVNELAGPNGEGASAALQRIEDLRELTEVWKGTSEEKARLRFVEILTKSVEDRKRGQSRDITGNTGSGYRVRTNSQLKVGIPRR